jgi:hypothetical protein
MEERMGQYYLVVNIDKEQYLNPHSCGDGLKLLEFGCSAKGTLTGLAILLADGNCRGGGDLRSTNPIIGTWAGDRIVVTGDYADEGRFVKDPKRNLYEIARQGFQDVSRQPLRAMADDPYLAQSMKQSQTWHDEQSCSVFDFAMRE